MTQHYHTADPREYDALADRYLRSVPPSAEALSVAGYKTFTDPNSGEVMVKLPRGGTVSIRASTRAGLF